MIPARDTSGTAYPVSEGGDLTDPGMSLRDYFAAQAMAAWLHGVDDANKGKCARFAYEMADAMLVARRSV